jgi:elongation factor P--(R)-beta-lysine ligase
LAPFVVLRERARLLDVMRSFFRERGVLEVDTPVLQGGANLDHGVDPFDIHTPDGLRFLPTSPEHPLKRLVAAGSGPIWTLAPAFRRGESGRRHRPEFRMLEWYRPDWDDLALIDEVIDLFATLTNLGSDHERLSWREAYQRYANLDPVTASDTEVRTALGTHRDTPRDRREALDLVLGLQVEPQLGGERWCVLTDYPAEAAAQARLRERDGIAVAARFEIYRNGIELANGYHELRDATDLAARLETERAARVDAERLRHDEHFAAAMQHGLGDCAGVAVGFDRIIALALGISDIGETMAFPFERA